MIKNIATCILFTLLWITPAFAKYPVLIVPGTNDVSANMVSGCLKATLERAGYEVHTVDFPNTGQGFIQEDVKRLKKAIDKITNGQPGAKVDIIAYSRGGLVAELYTMMDGDQYESKMDYTYRSADSKYKDVLQTKTITDIPRYSNDINQIIMMGTPNKGSFAVNCGYLFSKIADFFHDEFNTPNPHLPAMEQQRTNSPFINYFMQNDLNPSVKYTNLAEDWIPPGIPPEIVPMLHGGDGVVSVDSASGAEKHQDLLTIKLRSKFAPDAMPVPHGDMYNNPYFKKEVLQTLLEKESYSANISISPEQPVKEGSIQITLTSTQPLPKAPRLGGRFYDKTLFTVSLSGTQTTWTGTLAIPKDKDNSAMFTYCNYVIEIPERCEGESKCQVIVNIKITSGQTFLIDTEKPEVEETAPANGEVIYASDMPMDVEIFAHLFDPPIWGYASGIDDETIVLETPQHKVCRQATINHLDYGRYKCSIVARDNANEPGHDLKTSPYTWQFKIVPVPNVSVTGSSPIIITRWYDCNDNFLGQDKTPGNASFKWGVINTKKNITYSYKLTPGHGWTTFGNKTSASYSISETGNYTLSVRAKNEETGDIGPEVSANVFIDVKTIINKSPSCPPTPDENHSISMLSPEAIEVNLDSDILILNHGCSGLMSEMLKAIGCDFNIRYPAGGIDLFNKYSVLLVPSGGFMGLDDCERIKSTIDEYVSNGGTLVCFSQPYGKNFEMLPGARVTGMGWLEDLACWSETACIETPHVAFASQQKIKRLAVNIDGYLTSWPQNSTILLRRENNQMPVMLMYPYGKGRVVVSTMYSDWGKKYGQASNDELRIIGDLIAWARSGSAEIPKYYQKTPIDIPINVINNTGTQATTVELWLKNSHGMVMETRTIQCVVDSQSAFVVNYQHSGMDTLGIIEIGYVLKDSANNIVQDKKVGKRFAVVLPMVFDKTIIPDLSFSISGPKEDDILWYRETSEFTVNITNYTNRDISGIVHGETHWTHERKGFYVRAMSTTSVVFNKNDLYFMGSNGRFKWEFYAWLEYENKRIGGKWITGISGDVTFGNVNVSAVTSKGFYRLEEDTVLMVTVENLVNKGCNMTLDMGFPVKGNESVYLPPYGKIQRQIIIDSNILGEGWHWINISAWNKDYNYRMNGGGRVNVIKVIPQLDLRCNLPDRIGTGTNKITFIIKNTGCLDALKTGTLSVSLSSPGKKKLWEEEIRFKELKIGEEVMIDMDLPYLIDGLGDYLIKAMAFGYGGNNTIITKNIPCFVTIECDIEKPWGFAGKYINGTITLTNCGICYEKGLSMVISVGGINYRNTITTIALSPSQSISIPLNMFIPFEAIDRIQAIGNILVWSGNDRSYETKRQFGFYILAAPLKVEWIDRELRLDAKNEVLAIKNPGTGKCEYAYEITLTESNNNYGGLTCCKKGTGSVNGGGTDVLSMVTPKLKNGMYRLSGRCEWLQREIYYDEQKKEERVRLIKKYEYISRQIEIKDGLEDNLNIVVDKGVYSPGEAIKITNRIVNSGDTITNGKLIIRLMKEGGEEKFTFSQRAPNILPGWIPEDNNLADFLFSTWKDDTGVVIEEKELILDKINTGEEIEIEEWFSAPNVEGDGSRYWVTVEMRSGVPQLLEYQKSKGFYVTSSGLIVLLDTDKKAYKSGEVIKVTGRVVNNNPVDRDIGVIICKDDKEIQREQMIIKAYQEKTISMISLPGTQSFTLKARCDDGYETLKQVWIFEPNIDITINADDVVGRGTHSFNVIMKNFYPLDIDVEVWGESLANGLTRRKMTIPAGDTEIIDGQFSTVKDGTIIVVMSGDVSAACTKHVEFGEKISVAAQPEMVYRDGYIELPFTITNEGKLDSEFEIKAKMRQIVAVPMAAPSLKNGCPWWCQDGLRIVIHGTHSVRYAPQITGAGIDVSRIFYIPAGGSLSGNFVFNVPEGNYELQWDLPPFPSSNGQVEVKVRKNGVGRIADINCRIDELGRTMADIRVQNLGANELVGKVRLECMGFEMEQEIRIGIGKDITATIVYPNSFPTGRYQLHGMLMYEGQQIHEIRLEKYFKPVFDVYVPDGIHTLSGTTSMVNFEIKNTGFSHGEVEVWFELGDMVTDGYQKVSLRPNGTSTLQFNIQIPEEIEENDYYGMIRWKWDDMVLEKPVKIHINGISLNVKARLDKRVYLIGEKAKLILTIQNSGQINAPKLMVKVRFDEYETKQDVVLGTEPCQLEFMIPIESRNATSIFYGIYSQGNGRSIYLNTIYLHQGGNEITVSTDKDVYKAGEEMRVMVLVETPGSVTVSLPGYSHELYIDKTWEGKFTLPAGLNSGTYRVFATSSTSKDGNVCMFDVIGYSVKVLECRLDKSRYLTTDKMSVLLRLDVGCEIDGVLELWIGNSPNSDYTRVGSMAVKLVKGINIVKAQVDVFVSKAGTYRLMYGISVADRLIICDSKYFDAFYHEMSRDVYWGWNMVSIPFIPDDASLHGVFGDDVAGDMWMYQWDGQANEYKAVIDKIEHGKGYWFGVLGTTTIDVTGNMVDESKEYTLTLNKGWNMIGCPFRFVPDWSKAMIEYNDEKKSLQDAESAGWIKNKLFGFNPLEWEYYLAGGVRPMEGYWFPAMIDCKLIIPPIPVQTVQAPKQLGSPVLDGWQASINVVCGRYQDKVWIGMSEKSRDGMDGTDEIKPPFIGGVSISCTHHEEIFGNLIRDMKGLSDRLVWDVQVKNSLTDEIVMDWNELPSGYRFTLVDMETDRQVNMNTSRNYRYHVKDGNAGIIPGRLTMMNGDMHRFRIIAVREDTYTGSIRVYPNPTSNEVIFDGVTPNTEIMIFTISGELVRTIQGSQIWRTDNDAGERVASGVYFWLAIDGERKQTGKIGVIR